MPFKKRSSVQIYPKFGRGKNHFVAKKFAIIPTMNPCPYGWLNDPQKPVGVRLLSLPNTRNGSRLLVGSY
jgi:hypothetical protein